jgi:ribosomal protein L31E
MSKFKNVIQAAKDQPSDPQPMTVTLRRQSKIGKRSSDAHTQVSAYVRTHIHKAVKHELVDLDFDFSDLVDLLLEQWLKGRAQ